MIVYIALSVLLYGTQLSGASEAQWPSFDDAMSVQSGYRKELVTIDPTWNFVKQLYDRFVHVKKDPEYLRIPKIIHHIWLGSPLPSVYKELRHRFMELHPGWEFILWTEKEIDEFGLKNRAMYDATSNYGEKSDIARYEILYRFGGLYVDTDFKCLKSFEDLHYTCDFYTGFVGDTVVTLQNGMIGSAPGNPILKLCIDLMQRNEGEGDTFQEILQRTGPELFQRAFFAVAGQNDLIEVALPPDFVYPWPWYYRWQHSQNDIDAWIKPHSIAMHLWHVSWNQGKTD